MKKTNLSVILLTALVIASFSVFTACGGDDKDDGSGDVQTADVSVVKAGEQIQLDFSGGSEEYIIMPYFTVEEDTSMVYSLTQAEIEEGAEGEGEGEGEGESEGEGEGEGEGEQDAKIRSNDASGDLFHQRWEKKLAWDRKMHEVGRKIAREKSYINVAALQRELNAKRNVLLEEGSCTKTSDCGGIGVCLSGACVSEVPLKFTDFSNQTTDITVGVKKVGTHVALLVDLSDTIEDAAATEVVEKFDSVIYTRDQGIFGSTTVDGTDYSDVNGDGVNWIVMSHLVNESGAVGLFNPEDFTEEHNGADILWVVVPDEENSMDSIFGTAAHEYFHLMIYSQKVVRHGGDNETLFLNESLAHNAEEASGFGIDNIDTTYALMTGWADLAWAFSDDTIEARAMGFTFVRYIFEQLGGAEYSADSAEVTDKGGVAFLQALVTSDLVGFENINAALGDKTWKDYWPGYLAALALDNLPDYGNDPKYSFKDIYEDPLTGQTIGVCTHCTRTNASGSDVDFNGPEDMKEYEDGLEGETYATGFDVINVTTQESSIGIDTAIEDEESAEDFGFCVIRTK